MPIYQYKCNNCGLFEITQKITEEPIKTCPTCGGDVKKMISSGIGIVFKGSGFYCTDNRNSTAGNKAKTSNGG